VWTRLQRPAFMRGATTQEVAGQTASAIRSLKKSVARANAPSQPRRTMRVDLSRFLRQIVKSQKPANGELTHSIVSTEVHK
jgi:hypothetical protein